MSRVQIPSVALPTHISGWSGNHLTRSGKTGPSRAGIAPRVQLIALQYAPEWEDKARSHRLVETMLSSIKPDPGALVVLPEMGDTGWSFNLDSVLSGDSPGWAAELAQTHGIHLQVGFAEPAPDGKAFNCTVIARPDGTLGPVYRKMHPFSYGREGKYFKGGDVVVVDRLPQAAVCPTICYDLRFPEMYRHAARAGAEVMTVIASWPGVRAAHWRALAIARAIENQAYVIATNRTGSDPSFVYRGSSVIVSPHGEILAEGGDQPCAIKAEFNRTVIDDWRKGFPAIADIRGDLLGESPPGSNL